MIDNKTPLKFFFDQMVLTFFLAIICVTLTGIAISGLIVDQEFVFFLSDSGIPYISVLQVLLISVVISFINLLIFSDWIFKKTMLLWRTVIFLLSVFIVVGALVALFEWFPLYMREGWLGFFAMFITCSVCTTAAMLIATKIADKKYSKLLSDYKQKESGEKQ
jgi:hypothetical protein